MFPSGFASFFFFFNLIKPWQSSISPQTVLTPLELQINCILISTSCPSGLTGQPFFSSRTPPSQTFNPIRLLTCTETQNTWLTSFKFRNRVCVPSPKFICSSALSCHSTQSQHSKERLLHQCFMQSKTIHRLLSFAAAVFHTSPFASILLV